MAEPGTVYTHPAAKVPGALFDSDGGGMTVLLYGHPGTWKTTWSAQWPGVVFLSIAAEGGEDALFMYPQIAADLIARSQMPECPPVFNIAVPPRINIHGRQQMVDEVEKICLHHKQWGVHTVVVDSLTYLIDLWIDRFVQHMDRTNSGWSNRVKKQGGELLGPREWGFLNMYLRSLRMKLSNEGLNVIWTCLQRDTYASSQGEEQSLVRSEPMITGQAKVKLPGMCKIHINAVRSKVPIPNGPPGRMMIQPTFYTAPDMKTDMRHKYYNKFPKGCLWDPEFQTLPTFRAIWTELHEYISVKR